MQCPKCGSDNLIYGICESVALSEVYEFGIPFPVKITAK